MKILMISSYLPYPLFSGGQTRLYNLIRELSDRHEITLICEKRKYQTETDVENLEKICKKVITVERHKQWSLKNLAKTATTSRSFLVTGHTHPQMQKIIKEELLKEKFDLIHVETFYVIQNLFESGIMNYESWNIPVVLVEHNIEYRVYKRFVDRAPIALRPLLTLDIIKIRREEKNSWKQATKVVAVSEEDKKIMEQAGINPAIVPNGANINEFRFKEKSLDKLRMKKVLFIGDFKWIQNQDSVKFIIKDIWPLINSELKLWIVGRKIPESIKNLTNDPNVIFDENSSKPAPEIFQETDILLAPIRIGGGTSYKILESMSSGTPVVTMQMSASALHAKDGEHLMVGRTAQELAEKTIELLQNEKLYKKIAREARQLVEKKYSWKNIAKDLEQVYKSAILGS